MEHKGLGIRILGEARQTGSLTLNEEQQDKFDQFVVTFLNYIEE